MMSAHFFMKAERVGYHTMVQSLTTQVKYTNYSEIQEACQSVFCSFLAVILLLARAAIATRAPKHSVYYLNETQDEFNGSKSQEDRK